MKTIAIFGATGRTGKLALDDCLARGWACRVLVRDATKLKASTKLWVRQGDARVAEDVQAVLYSADAVLCCLGMSDVTVPATDFSDSVRTILQAMPGQNVRRMIAIASAGVLPHPTGGYRNKEGLPDYLKHVAAEHVRNYEQLRASGLDWTLMCPVSLLDDIPLGKGRYLFEDLPSGSHETGYADLAHVMVELLDEPASLQKRVGIVSDR